MIGAEDEVLLPPGCRFKVESVLEQEDLTFIQLTELPSKEWIANLNPKPNALGAPPAAVAPHPHPSLTQVRPSTARRYRSRRTVRTAAGADHRRLGPALLARGRARRAGREPAAQCLRAPPRAPAALGGRALTLALALDLT